MMTRTARGHTGRPLRADGWEIAMFVLVQLAALARVGGGLAPAAYGLYAIRYWPVLSRDR